MILMGKIYRYFDLGRGYPLDAQALSAIILRTPQLRRGEGYGLE